MKIDKKLLIKIIISSVLFLLLIVSTLLSINLFKQNSIQSKGLVVLSEIYDIKYVLNKYHLLYGEYPRTNSDVVLNGNSFCGHSFNNNNQCVDNEKISFQKYTNNFIYSVNEDGLDYNIKLVTNYDNEELGCVHSSKEKKSGCLFQITSTSQTVEK